MPYLRDDKLLKTKNNSKIMWKKIVFLTAAICCSYSAMADSYAKQLKEKITNIENRSDIDPDSFAIDIKILEDELSKLNTESIKMPSEKRTTYKSILRGVLATAYNSMLYSNINAFDEETKNKYRKQCQSHAYHEEKWQLLLRTQHVGSDA